MQQAAQPIAPTPAVAMVTAPALPEPAAELLPAATGPAATAPAATGADPALAATGSEPVSTPLARLLAQLRRAGEPVPPTSAPLVTPAPPVQPQSGVSAPAQLVEAVVPAASQTTALTQAATPAVSYTTARPLMLPVPEVVLPAYFCSNDARNAFHNESYRPAVEIATRNNEAAVAYMRQLQQTYDRGQIGRDTAVLNAISAEARAYQSEAARAYSAQAVLVRQFDSLMTVPLRTCMASAQ
jgi:hypothetical protein